jgi:hypothetical protein
MVLVGKVQLLFRHDIARHFSLDVLGRGVETRTSSLGDFSALCSADDLSKYIHEQAKTVLKTTIEITFARTNQLTSRSSGDRFLLNFMKF